MSYRIVYNNCTSAGTEVLKKKTRLIWFTVFFFILFGITTAYLWPEGREVLMDIFLPGDPEVTWTALETLSVRLRSGEAPGDAAWAFCREIINGTQTGY